MERKRKLLISEGQRIGRLTVIKEIKAINCQGYEIRKVVCICDCGNTVSPNIISLFNGKTKSCGCLQKENITKLKTKHNMSTDPIYKIHQGMMSRCYNKKRKFYYRYGGRGIFVCDEWIKDRKLFFDWAYSNGYKKGLTIERIDNNKGYSPDNCCFVSQERQCNNTRRNHIIQYNEVRLSMPDFCRKYDLNYPKFARRIVRQKYSIEKAMKNCEGFVGVW